MADRRADDDVEAQMDRALPLQGQEDEQRAPNYKPAWLDQNGQYSQWVLLFAAQLILNLLTSGQDFIQWHNVHFITPLALILFLVFLLAAFLGLYKWGISGKERVKYPQKMVIMSLTLLNLAALKSGNVIFLAMVDKSYLPILVSIAVLVFIALVILFYSKVEQDQEHEPQGRPNEAVENKVKSCYKIANFTVTIGFGVQTVEVIYCLKNQVPPKDHPQYSLIVAYITSMLGSISSTITTSPLQFQSDLMHRILKQMPIIMLLFQGLVAVFVASKILNPTMVVFAVCIPSIVMFLVTLCPKSSNLREQLAEEDYKLSMFGAFAVIGSGAIAILYLLKLESGGTYLTSAVFFLLMAVITSLIKMAFIFRLKCAYTERVNNALPMVLTLVGVALLLMEFCKDVTSIGMGIAATPIAAPGHVLPPLPHSVLDDAYARSTKFSGGN